MKKLMFCTLLLLNCVCLNGMVYDIPNAPIDVIIPSTEKDLDTLELCIEGIRYNCDQVRRIIVVSNKQLTTKAEWFDEKLFPFSKEEVAYYLAGCDEAKAKEFLVSPQTRIGWYLQQLIKLYAPYVIPEISSNVLHLDSDTIFLNPICFLNDQGEALYNPGTEYHMPYFDHMARLLPGERRMFPEHSGITHHMLLQKPILDDLFQAVELHHHMDLWKAYCLSINPQELYLSGSASDEVYFNFAFARTNQVHLRFFKWDNIPSLKCLSKYKKLRYHFVSCHSWSRTD